MATKKQKVIFKRAGDSISIGGQRFDASNITTEMANELIRINPANADHFEFMETEHDKSIIEEEEKLAKETKPAAKKQPAE